MKRWPIVKLNSVTAKVGSGATPRGGEAVYKPSGVPLIRSMNVHFNGFRDAGLVYLGDKEASLLDHVKVHCGDVLFNITGASIGRVTTAPAEMEGARVNQHVCIIRPTQELLPQFLSYYLRSPEQQSLVGSNQVGGTRQAITKEILLNWGVPLPPLTEQKRIVMLLEKADELQKLRTQADRRTAAIIPALFHDLFGHESGENSKSLGDVCYKITDGVHLTPTYVDEGIPFLRVTDIQDEEIHWHKVKYIPKSEYDDITKRVAPERGDVLYSKNGTVGIAKEITWERPFAHFVSLALLKPNREILNPTFLTAWLNTPDALRQAIGRSKTGTVTNLHLNEIRKMRIPCPPMETQLSFVRLMTATREMEARQAGSRTRLGNLFQAMLHQAFIGQL